MGQLIIAGLFIVGKQVLKRFAGGIVFFHPGTAMPSGGLRRKIVAEIGTLLIPHRLGDIFTAIPMGSGAVEAAVPAYPQVPIALGAYIASADGS
jgi:hypothetical protein